MTFPPTNVQSTQDLFYPHDHAFARSGADASPIHHLDNPNLTGTFISLILTNLLGWPFFVYMMMRFNRGLPKELNEAAMIIVCNKDTIFCQIIPPLLGPSIITTIVISFYWIWDGYMGPVFF